MNISITHNSVEIVHKVLNYTRTQDICSGIGTLEFSMEYENDVNLEPWDLIKIYEDGDQVGEYYISTFDKDYDTGVKSVTCQDGSKLLQDYFVDDSYVLSSPTSALYWIELFLNQAQVSYTINASGNGATLSENSSLGLTSAYEIIIGLLQQSGWYMYFNSVGTCIIDTLSKDISDNPYTVNDTEILSLKLSKSDSSMRNRAVVWGNYSAGSWVFVDRRVKTGYETSANDDRAVVIANSTIYSAGTAATIANKLLNEFAKLNFEKTVTLAGYHPLVIGDLLNIDSNYYTGIGMITNYQVSASPKSGVITTLVLDARCPRLFAYYGYITWVYTGTDGQGVWRKRLDSATWQDFSTGLSDYNVTDLIIKNSVFACVANGKSYINTSHYIANWKLYDQGILIDSDAVEYQNTETEAVAVDIDESNNDIYICYKLTDAKEASVGYQRSWIVIITPKRTNVNEYPVKIATTNLANVYPTDVEKYTTQDLITVVASGAPFDPTLDANWGYKLTHPLGIKDDDSLTISTPDTGVTYSGVDIIHGTSFNDTVACDTILYGRRSMTFGRSTFQYIAWSGDTPYSIEVPLKGMTLPAGFSYYDIASYWQEETNEFGIPIDYNDRHYVVCYLYDKTSPKEMRFTAKEFTPVLSGYPYLLDSVSVCSDSNITLNGLQIIDDILVSSGDRVLVAGQTNSIENGTYLANSGDWTRTSDILDWCATIVVASGTVYEDSVFQIETDNPVIDETPISILEVLIPTTTVNDISIVVSSTYPTITFSDSPTLINGVFYWDYLGYSASSVPYTIALKMFKFNCETGSYSNTIINTFGTYNYVGTFGLNLITVPCGSGVAQVITEYRQPKYGTTFEDPIIESDTYLKLFIYRHTYSDVSTSSNTIVSGTATSYYTDSCYMSRGPGPYSATPVARRYQGCKIENGLYHPYIKFRFRTFISETYRDEDSFGCLSCAKYIDRTASGGVSEVNAEQLTLYTQIYDIYTGVLVLNESSEQTYNFNITGTSLNCSSETVDGWMWELNTDTLDDTEWNASYGDNYLPIYSKGIPNPIYIVNNTTVKNGAAKDTTLSTLSPANKVISQNLDDLDNCIYIYDSSQGKVFKEEYSTATVKSTFILPTTPTAIDNFTYTNQLFIFDNGYATTNYDIFYNPTRRDIYKLSDDIIVSLTSNVSYLLSRNDENTFDIVDTDYYSLSMESSLEWPLTTRTVGESLDVTVSTKHFRLFSTYPTYVQENTTADDIRLVTLAGEFVFETGSLSLEYKKYVLVTTNGNLYIIDPDDTATQHNIYTLSGISNKIETSNNYFPQYLFYSAFVGSSGIFMQRFPIYDTNFVDHSDGMPTTEITVIRLDDRV